MAKVLSTRLARWLSGESTWANTHSVHLKPDAGAATRLQRSSREIKKQPESLEDGWPTNLALAAVNNNEPCFKQVETEAQQPWLSFDLSVCTVAQAHTCAHTHHTRTIHICYKYAHYTHTLK